jgi:hypothetical protein
MSICSEIVPALAPEPPWKRPRRHCSRQPLLLDNLRRVELPVSYSQQRLTTPATRHFFIPSLFTLFSPESAQLKIARITHRPPSHG